MGMQAAGGGGGLQSEINVTPMVDVMLVLLIIFMVVTPFLQQGIQVAIPRELKNPDEDQAINKESAVIISVPKDGDYYLGKKKVNLDDLKAAVEKALANQERRRQDCLYQERHRRQLRRGREGHQCRARKRCR